MRVDDDIPPAMQRIVADPAFVATGRALTEAIVAGRRVFLTGCGATGRLAILLEAAWRTFWQERARRGRALRHLAQPRRHVRQRDGGRRPRADPFGRGLRGLDRSGPLSAQGSRRRRGRRRRGGHRRRRDFVCDRHRLAGVGGRGSCLLCLQQSDGSAPRARGAFARGHRRAADHETRSVYGLDGNCRLDADAGHDHRVVGHRRRAGAGLARRDQPLGPARGGPPPRLAGTPGGRLSTHVRAARRAAPPPRECRGDRRTHPVGRKRVSQAGPGHVHDRPLSARCADRHHGARADLPPASVPKVRRRRLGAELGVCEESLLRHAGGMVSRLAARTSGN